MKFAWRNRAVKDGQISVAGGVFGGFSGCALNFEQIEGPWSDLPYHGPFMGIFHRISLILQKVHESGHPLAGEGADGEDRVGSGQSQEFLGLGDLLLGGKVGLGDDARHRNGED